MWFLILVTQYNSFLKFLRWSLTFFTLSILIIYTCQKNWWVYHIFKMLAYCSVSILFLQALSSLLIFKVPHLFLPPPPPACIYLFCIGCMPGGVRGQLAGLLSSIKLVLLSSSFVLNSLTCRTILPILALIFLIFIFLPVLDNSSLAMLWWQHEVTESCILHASVETGTLPQSVARSSQLSKVGRTLSITEHYI